MYGYSCDCTIEDLMQGLFGPSSITLTFLTI